ncbi:hypothetical protein [Salinibacter ruber]|uniref:hypothetical protein n=1 Tax=Salinibacter ruber TaxID=146919 RepID=UPI00216882FD|nr:hypothetical protein [Salinibacter ruber]MCS3956331.1 hypothetical protein [Salinibacter ruber]
MPEIPAFCQECGAVFGSGIVIDDATNVTLAGNSAGPCPECSGTGHIPDGVFNFVDEAVEVLSAPEHSSEQLRRLVALIEEASQENASPEEIEESIRTELPEFASLTGWLPQTRKELYDFLKLLLLAVSILPPALSGSEEEVELSEQERRKLVDEVVQYAIKERNLQIDQQATGILEELRADPDSTSSGAD